MVCQKCEGLVGVGSLVPVRKTYVYTSTHTRSLSLPAIFFVLLNAVDTTTDGEHIDHLYEGSVLPAVEMPAHANPGPFINKRRSVRRVN